MGGTLGRPWTAFSRPFGEWGWCCPRPCGLRAALCASMGWLVPREALLATVSFFKTTARQNSQVRAPLSVEGSVGGCVLVGPSTRFLEQFVSCSKLDSNPKPKAKGSNRSKAKPNLPGKSLRGRSEDTGRHPTQAQTHGAAPSRAESQSVNP